VIFAGSALPVFDEEVLVVARKNVLIICTPGDHLGSEVGDFTSKRPCRS
jgi:hypothetical protein